MQTSDSAPQLPQLRYLFFGVVCSNLTLAAVFLLRGPTPANGTLPLYPIVALAVLLWALAWKLPSFLVKTMKKDPSFDQKVVARMRNAWLIRMALLDSLPVIGLVLAFDGSVQVFWPLLAVGVLSMLTQFPSEEKFRAWAASL